MKSFTRLVLLLCGMSALGVLAFPAAPVAGFTFSPTAPTTVSAVSFTDSSTGSPTSWSWVFGDGATSSLQNPCHIYATAGTFTVSLTASNTGGANTTSKSVTVTPPAFNMAQTISDGAQSTTLAFDGLAMMTGNLDAQSFFPPGKVADYTGFQFLRDNDPDNMGHNTSFLTRVANNVIYILNTTQFAQLKTLAVAQQTQINLYGYKRFALMKAFRRLIDGDIPTGSTGLSLNAVKKASNDLYLIDGQISFDRALLYANIYSSMDATQKAYLDAMKGKGWNSWPDITDAQINSKMSGLPQGTAVAVMTYASDLFSWYAGSVDADVYFCPERHGTYYGGFYIKDAPAIGHEGYSIDEQLTATAGAALCDSSKGYVTQTQATVMSSLVDTQRNNLYAGATNIVQTRTQIATLLRSLLVSTASSSTVQTQVLALSGTYGDLDGADNYNYATVFAQIYKTLTDAQKAKLATLRQAILSGIYTDGTPFDFTVCTTPFLYSAVVTDQTLLTPYIADTDYLFFDTPTAAFSFTPGTPTVNQTVTFTDASAGNPTSWSWSFGDGTTSTAQNPTHAYSTAGSYTVTLVATNPGGTNTITKTLTVSVVPQVATPTFSPVAGSYVGSVTVTLNCATTGAVIHYTLDGTTPTSASSVYSTTLALSSTTTVKAYATATGMTDSALATAAYTITAPPQVATPTFSPVAGSYVGSVTVTLNCATIGAVIHYTLDGTTPTAASSVYSTTLALSSTTTVKVIATATGMTNSAVAAASYTITAPPQAAAPTFSPAAGSYTGSVIVTLACATTGAVIHYTLDGTTPTTVSSVYSSAVTLNSTTTVKALATATGMTNSAVAIAAYTITALPQVAAPTFSPVAGNYTGSVTVTLDCDTSGAEIHYTLDGSTPTATSSLFTVPLIITSTTTIKAIGIMSGMTNSTVVSAVYTLLPAAPTFTPASCNFTSPLTVSLACANTNATIYYTTDSSTPTAASPKYAGSILISATTTLKAIAITSGLAASAITSGVYTYTPPQVVAPMMTPASSTFNGSVTVAIACATAGAIIRYTTNGTAPTSTSLVYSHPLTLTASTTLMAQAFKTGLLASTVTTGKYQLGGDQYEPDDSPAQAKTINNGQAQVRSIGVVSDVDWAKFTLTQKSDVRIETYGPSGDTALWLYGPNSSTAQLAYNDDNGASKFSLITLAGANALSPGTYYIKVQQYGNSNTIPFYALQLNTTGPNQVATPIATPHTGTYKAKVVVTLATPTPGAAIRYTTDGTDPTQYSQLYTGPITLTTKTTIKAASFRTGYFTNTLAAEEYTITP